MIDRLKKLFPNFLKVWYHKLRFLIANLRAGFPNKKLKLIGITGSSGKSTTSFMTYHILKNSGVKVGLISTIGAYIDDEEMDTGLHVTTPDAHNIPNFLKKMLSKGVEYVVIEVSSHALAQGRLGNLKFDLSTITNITSDHLDWHKTWENYANAKCKIVEMTKGDGVIILNEDDQKSFNYIEKKFANTKHPKFITFSTSALKDIVSDKNQSFSLNNIKFNIPIIGGYNISNALAAINIAKEVNISIEDSSKALRTFKTLVGHMEVLSDDEGIIILDFAHNTDSLEKSLIEARNLIKGGGKLISLFGSAGLRDVKKRYDMGLVAGKLSDIVIVVPEDPRTESLYEINSEILRGCEDSNLPLIKRIGSNDSYTSLKNSLKEIDRGTIVFDYEDVQARIDGIELGIDLLKENDILITQGKGHEQSLCFGKTEYPYDEKEVINNLLKNKNG
jgi:UDP-N-acetylmuramoyl-L-alanyl-D-glutamate--2,6-diaminopimelate ligase